MTTVTMLTHVSGTRDGEDWPAKGETLRVSAEEAAALIGAGIATAKAAPEVEVAVAPESAVETATLPTKPRRKS
jgi:hypothetical protein